jgi:hypothetical protein
MPPDPGPAAVTTEILIFYGRDAEGNIIVVRQALTARGRETETTDVNPEYL